jgi:hypothetical protein
MIKINLLPQKRAKRGAAAPRRGAGGAPSATTAGRQIAIGAGVVAGALALFVLAVDLPAKRRTSDYKEKTAALRRDIDAKAQSLVGYDKLAAAQTETIKKLQAIDRLLESKIVPAYVLHELGSILTKQRSDGGGPTRTKHMDDLIKADATRAYDKEWDGSRVWLMSFADTAGQFRLEIGAQSQEDVTQLSKRLAASVYFADIALASGERVSDRESGINYLKFTITGKVAY